MEFPRFNRDDILGWISKCEMYFQLNEIPEELKVTMASLHLDEKAYRWHQSFEKMQEGRGIMWEMYTEAIKKRFEPVYEDSMEELMQLRQMGTVSEHQYVFDDLVCKLNLLEAYLISCYIAGLKRDIA